MVVSKEAGLLDSSVKDGITGVITGDKDGIRGVKDSSLPSTGRSTDTSVLSGITSSLSVEVSVEVLGEYVDSSLTSVSLLFMLDTSSGLLLYEVIEVSSVELADAEETISWETVLVSISEVTSVSETTLSTERVDTVEVLVEEG